MGVSGFALIAWVLWILTTITCLLILLVPMKVGIERSQLQMITEHHEYIHTSFHPHLHINICTSI